MESSRNRVKECRIVIEVTVDRVVIYQNDLLVLLRGEGDRRVLPISVEPGQARAIQLEKEGARFPRPLTHDLFKNVLDKLNCRLLRSVVCDLVDGTFYARLVLSGPGGEAEVDARPSDAVALALRCSAPIFVEDHVMEASGVVLEVEPAEVKKVSRSEILSRKLQKAIDEERYEDAAKLRDELKLVEENKTSN